MIDAPVHQVWQAWSDPMYVKQWWGPIGFTAPVAGMDFREGGTSLVGMRSPDGHDMFHTWTYRTIVPMEPAAIGLSPDIPREVRHTVVLRSLGENRTEVTVTESGYSSGPELELSRTGQEQCLDKMAALLTGRQND